MSRPAASLAWYPAAAPVWDALWAEVRARLGEGPERLDRPSDFHAHWADPALVLAQTCGLPWRIGLAPNVRMIGAFDFGLPGVPPGHYASVLVQRADDARPVPEVAAAGVAANGLDSQSGWGSLHLAGLIPGPVTVTGAHAASMEAVAEGRAHLAAIDAVTWRLSPHPRLSVRGWTPPTPGCPLITGRPELADRLRAILPEAVAALPAPLRRRAGLRGFVLMDPAAYEALPLPPRPAAA